MESLLRRTWSGEKIVGLAVSRTTHSLGKWGEPRFVATNFPLATRLRKNVNRLGVGLATRAPFTGVSGPFGPEIRKMKKESVWGPQKVTMPEKVKKHPKKSNFGRF